jgi:hypothetical protein
MSRCSVAPFVLAVTMGANDMSEVMPPALVEATKEVLADIDVVLGAVGTDVLIPIVDKYATLVVMREALPHALMALQYHTTTPKAKEALTAALRILAQAKGAELPEKPR